MILWKQQEGFNATVGHLADVLEKIGRKRIAEKLLGRLLITLSTYTESTYYRTVFVLNRDHVYSFKSQYPPTNSRNWSLHFVYISTENNGRAIRKVMVGVGNFLAAGIFFRYQIPCMNFFLGHGMNMF